MAGKFRITFIQPSIGRKTQNKYIKTWQMEPLTIAALAALTPDDVECSLFDDRIEEVGYDHPTDLVAMPVEAYTAKRAYQIASEYRRRGVPVVMGGFHPSLCPEDTALYAESVAVGEAENIWPEIVDDYRHGTARKIYRETGRPSLERSNPDRSIYGNRRYLPMRLVEVGRGCHFGCDFCSIQTFYQQSYRRRPVGNVIRELRDTYRRNKLVFFVDDNLIAERNAAREFLQALIPLKVRWVSQASINVGKDEEILSLLQRSGCEGLLIGFESMNPANLAQMGKSINRGPAEYSECLQNLHRFGIRIYGTFVFGYDNDTPESYTAALAFAEKHGFYLTGFNHLMPMPGTPLYQKLEAEGRLLYPKWWLDDNYSYNKLVFRPKCMTPQEVRERCIAARRAFYSYPSILKRHMHPVNRRGWFMVRNFLPLNILHRNEIGVRDDFPMGDPRWNGQLIEAT